MQQSKYNPTIGYLKALGIMLMVLGHSGCSIPTVVQFLYMFHMPLFFIASGYCFKEKYLSNPKLYLYNKVKGIWWPYMKWSLLFLLLHNVCFHLNLYNDHYGWREYVSHLYEFSEFKHLAFCIIFNMRGHEQLLGGYWFLNALFFGSLIAWVVIKLVKIPLFGGGNSLGNLHYPQQDLLAYSLHPNLYAGFCGSPADCDRSYNGCTQVEAFQ